MKEQVDMAVEVLRRGGIILYPTDTVWGIGCDAANLAAVEKIYGLKRSKDKKGMIVLVSSPDQASRYTGRVPEVAWQLMEVADKPLTLILPNGCGVAENLLADDGSVAVRVPSHPFCEALLRRFGKPVVSTSANISGGQTPLHYDEISGGIKNSVDFAVNPEFEKGATGKPSSIIKLGEGGEIEIIRE